MLPLQYIGVERSAARRASQAAILQTHIARNRFSSLADMPEHIPYGCIFSNELFDAFPVHRVMRENGELREVYVTLGGDGLCDEVGPLSTPALAEYFSEMEISLQEDQLAEVCLQARDWIEDAAKRLQRGFVLTIDYGHEARELYDERHMRGTLLAYGRHRASEDFYRAPGEQDLTAHVNFTALDVCGAKGRSHANRVDVADKFPTCACSARKFCRFGKSGSKRTRANGGKFAFQNAGSSRRNGRDV